MKDRLQEEIAMSKVRVIKKVPLSVNIPEEMKEKLLDLADMLQCDLSPIVRAALQEFIDSYKDAQPGLFDDN